jgi:hypothetical protein
MKNVKKLLIFATISTFVFASWDRTAPLGGAGFWTDDYANISAFPASVNDHNVAYTNGSDFTSIFQHNGTTWGFSGGTDANDVVNMMWGNGTYGATFGLNMRPESADGTVKAETGFELGFGMPLAGMDFGFGLAQSGEIDINLRRSQSLWVWENMLINVGFIGEDLAVNQQGNTSFSVDCYTNKTYESGTSGLFALGFHYWDKGPATTGAVDPDVAMNLVWNFAVESAMTDWATLRVGYNKAYDFGGGQNNDGAVAVGLGFNYGSFSLDMQVAAYNDMLKNPGHYVSGRNADPIGSSWTISYNW